MAQLTLKDFARLFGVELDTFDDHLRALINQKNFEYEILEGSERDDIILEILEAIHTRDWTRAGKGGLPRWEKGWGENLETFRKSGFDLESLTPGYYHPNQVLRLEKNYIRAANPMFLMDFYTILRTWLFRRHLAEASAVYEFACGPGYNLVLLSEMFPNIPAWGLDWSEAACDLVNLIGETKSLPVRGTRFDMFSPDKKIQLPKGSVAMTFGGLEQLGGAMEPFISYLLEQPVQLILHVEPIVELYDSDNLVDYLALCFHAKRNYLNGLAPMLKKLESDGRIKLHHLARLQFGNLFHDGWSVAAYTPIRSEKG